MRTVFADTTHWVAILNPTDSLHSRANDVVQTLGRCRVVTSEFVLLEVLNLMATMGPASRGAACDTIGELRRNPNVEIVPATSMLFHGACKLYAQFSDKQWGCVDCSSCLIMKDKGITEALAYDHHFEQMGIRALLRDDGK